MTEIVLSILLFALVFGFSLYAAACVMTVARPRRVGRGRTILSIAADVTIFTSLAISMSRTLLNGLLWLAS